MSLCVPVCVCVGVCEYEYECGCSFIINGQEQQKNMKYSPAVVRVYKSKAARSTPRTQSEGSTFN